MVKHKIDHQESSSRKCSTSSTNKSWVELWTRFSGSLVEHRTDWVSTFMCNIQEKMEYFQSHTRTSWQNIKRKRSEQLDNFLFMWISPGACKRLILLTADFWNISERSLAVRILNLNAGGWVFLLNLPRITLVCRNRALYLKRSWLARAWF